jgi:processive 1,2-diacylglycerol beta-glucosyltransferase
VSSAAHDSDPLRIGAKRVLVLTAPIGDGHVAAARALAEGLRRARKDTDVVVCDVLPVLRKPLRWLLEDAYRWQLRSAPWLFGGLFAALRHSRLLRLLVRAGLSLTASRQLLRVVRDHPAEVIVSTWPIATTILGCLRLRGKVQVPVCATITDFAGLELWADRGIDLHLVMHDGLVPAVERIAGRGSAHAVSPLVASRFLTPRSTADARRALALGPGGVIVVVSGGGWGVGDLDGAVEAALAIDGVSVICLAGRDEVRRARLEDEYRTESRVTVLGFTEAMSDLLAAADVLIHSTGGVTCLEALARGCPIVAYGAPPGHAPLLAREMARLGLVAHARSTAELRTAIVARERRSPVALRRSIDAASLVLAAAPRVTARFRARLARTAAAAAVVALALLSVLASDLTYPVVAEALALPETTTIRTSRPEVALVVRGRRSELLAFAHVARQHNLHASVATAAALEPEDLSALRAARLDPIPEIAAGGIVAAIGTRRALLRQAASYGLRGRFHFLAPNEGFTITDYLLAREVGGTPLQARVDLRSSRRELAALRPGEIVVATLESDRSGSNSRLLRSIRLLRRRGLTISSVAELIARPPS